MEEWWCQLGELIARQLAQRWRLACGGPKPSVPPQENANAAPLRIQGIEPKNDADKPANSLKPATAGTDVDAFIRKVAAMPQVWRYAGATAVTLLGIGGLAYTAGAIVYARRKPDPAPRVFGYHELFHALTLVAVTCQYVAIAFFVVKVG